MSLMKLRFAMLFTLVVLFGTLTALSGVVVWLIAPDLYAASAAGLILLLMGLALGMTLLQFLIAPYVIRAFTNMKEMDPREHKWVYDMADDIVKKAGMKKRPKLYIVNDGTPNAFAFGYGQSHAFIALHTGLIEMLNKDEIKSVLAHEIGHVKHRDMIVITIASMVPILVYYLIVAAGSIIASRNRDEENSGLSGILVFLGAYVAQFFTTLIVLYLSRTRELYADTFGAAATNPRDMRTALAKISYGFPAMSGSKAKAKYEKTRAFFIADPIASSQEQRDRELGKDLEKSVKKREREGPHLDAGKQLEDAMTWERERAAAKVLNIFSTHPLTYKRIDNLYEFEKEGKKDPKNV